MKLKQGYVNPETGLVFWSRQAGCKDGLRWITPEAFAKKLSQISSYSKQEKVRELIKKRRNTDEERAKRNQYAKKWRASAEYKEKAASKAKERRAKDHLFCLADRARARLSEAIRRGGYGKRSSSNQIIGCSWVELAAHIESLFVSGMSWDNRNLWHIDHIKPLSSATTEQELIELCHYKNLQPLWAFDNQSKGNK